MLPLLRTLLISAICLCGACQTPATESDSGELSSEPKTDYGKSVRKAKDLGAGLEDRDEDVKKQMDEMSGE